MPSDTIWVNLTLSSPSNPDLQVTIDAVVDTGCSVDLLVPKEIAERLEVPFVGQQDVAMANGNAIKASTTRVDVMVGDRTAKNVMATCIPQGHVVLIGIPLLAKIGDAWEIQQSLKFLFKDLEYSVIILRRRLLDDFEALLNDPYTKEAALSIFLRENWWVLGPEYLGASSEDQLGLDARTDFLLQRHDGFHDIVEIKRANIDVFRTNSKRLLWSATVARAVNQMMDYLSKYSYLYLSQKEETGKDVFHPKGLVLAGRSNPDVDRQLRVCNAYLHGIEVRTYDSVVKHARAILDDFSGNTN